jgi:23S rRNA-intervening sequence protein
LRVRVPLRHHTLVAWQRADDLFIEVHQLTLKSFPSYEKYELGSQMRRAAFSIAVNIVEGCALPIASAVAESLLPRPALPAPPAFPAP